MVAERETAAASVPADRGPALARGIVGVLSVRVASVGAEFVLSFALARLLGAAEYGTYALVLAWVAMLSIPATLGFDKLTTREAASFKAREDWSRLRGLVERGSFAVAGFSMSLAVLAAALAELAGWMRAGESPSIEFLRSFQLGMVAIPLAALTRMSCAGLQGMGRPALALAPEGLFLPGTMLLLAMVVFVALDARASAGLGIGIYVTGTATACVVAIGLLRNSLPPAISRVASRSCLRSWLREARPFMFIVGLNALIANIDVIMIGAIRESASAGVYRIAWQVAAATSLPLMATNALIAPRIAGAHAVARNNEVETTVRAAGRMTVLLAMPIAALLLVFGRNILGAFGPGFDAGYAWMVTLVAGQFFSVAAGSVGYLLLMTGHARIAAVSLACAAIANVLLNAVLIPLFGPAGAAIASTATVVALNVAYATFVRRRLGIRTVFAL